ncbi:hypothetical protein RclHR1_14710002 [Rhizophagus clarus]|uniref:Uncharacterized protein n=1 Tax=Rhizophagus clarus TaxID=94130 RepID=A0A2Z6QF70_9GLOM|nr:hypothetical protein RclHR1_14710002 [Rhizophagus clarus]GES92826.1 hypothetical protein GLOIN_2v1788061 [Rhizophagus clarus]
MSTSKSYPGQDTLISYLKERNNKSYHGFLNIYRDVIIASLTSDLSWSDNAWTSNYIREVENIFADQEIVESLKQ